MRLTTLATVIACVVALGGATKAYDWYSDRSQSVTILPDLQANTDVNNRPVRPVIVTQTAEDVAASRRISDRAGWFPNEYDMYMKHPRVTTVAPHHRRVEIRIIRKVIDE